MLYTIYTLLGSVFVIGVSREKERSWIPGRDEYLLCRTTKVVADSKEKEPRSTYEIGTILLPIVYGRRDDFNRKITTRFHDDCSRPR